MVRVPAVLARRGHAEETVEDARRVCVEAPVGVPARGGGRSGSARAPLGRDSPFSRSLDSARVWEEG
jgi:hypothetical protein